MEDGLVRVELLAGKRVKVSVLILVVVDNGLVQLVIVLINNIISLNPCCSGQWSSTHIILYQIVVNQLCLNPCCSGQWSSTNFASIESVVNKGS